MSNQLKLITIAVYGVIRRAAGETFWQHLPRTSEFLTEIQLLPNAGDWVTTYKEDWPLLGLDPSKPDYRCLLIVKHRVTSYVGCDVAVICQFPDEQNTDQLPDHWQKIPLN